MVTGKLFKEHDVATRKKEDSGFGVLAGVILFIPFVIFTVIHYFRLRSAHPVSDRAQRIFDIGSLLPSIMAGGGIVYLCSFFVVVAADSKYAALSVPVLTVLSVWVCYQFAKAIAATYFGVLVDQEQDALFLPKDMANYGVEDYLRLRFIKDLGVVETIPLSQITKITREAGKKLYVHGPFGSRGIGFSNKQKRDECLAAIEGACRAAATLEFEDA